MDRAHKTVLWIEKFRCQNSNLNIPTTKNGFYRFSYPQDRLRIQNRIQTQFNHSGQLELEPGVTTRMQEKPFFIVGRFKFEF